MIAINPGLGVGLDWQGTQPRPSDLAGAQPLTPTAERVDALKFRAALLDRWASE
jgi:hypothetical protein